jgi:hypothetical protein
VTNAASGATINVSAGNGGTWSSPIVVDKSLRIIGAGIGQTTVSGRTFQLGAVDNVEISGFTFASLVDSTGFNIRGTHNVNIHHNSFTCTDWFQWIYTNSDANRTRYPTGVFHHNTFSTCRWVLNDGWNGTDNYSSRDGDLGWSSPDPLGTGDMLFFEDNTAQITDCPYGKSGILCNWIDTESGSRTVVRFNSLTNTYLECHPDLYSGHRGPRLLEIYGNTFTCTGGFCSGFIRPGLMKCNSFWWHNQTLAPMGSGAGQITMMDDRGYTGTQVYGTAPCNGTFFIDGNTSPTTTYRGWPCRDQPGTSTDAFKWDGSNPAPTQAYRPNYHWKNTDSNSEFDYDVNSGDWNPVQIVHNRDFFHYVSGFNGTSGVGEGTLAQRPATCTTNPSGTARTVGWGPGYWATDQGSWNTSTSNPQGVQANGADGVLYVCTATNTWTIKYTPYPYPHPLQSGSGGGGDTTPPQAPTNLRIL